MIVNSIRGSSGAVIERTNGLNQNSSRQTITLSQVQIGLLAKAKELQEDLRSIAKDFFPLLQE